MDEIVKVNRSNSIKEKKQNSPEEDGGEEERIDSKPCEQDQR